MRMTRFEYRQTLTREKPLEYQQALARLKTVMKRKLIADGVIVDPSKVGPKYEWHWGFAYTHGPEVCGVVKANTRSEARALIKAELGHALPTKLQIVRVEHDSPNAISAAA